jgi:hypothetical protein
MKLPTWAMASTDVPKPLGFVGPLKFGVPDMGTWLAIVPELIGGFVGGVHAAAKAATSATADVSAAIRRDRRIVQHPNEVDFR